MPTRPYWLYAGLFLVTLATLMLEVIDTRLLSVLTWYHLSFVAVSVAMLGMASGAVLVFLGGDLFAPERVARVLPGVTLGFAIALAVAHVANLTIPIPGVSGASVRELASLGISTIVLLVFFFVPYGLMTAELGSTYPSSSVQAPASTPSVVTKGLIRRISSGPMTCIRNPMRSDTPATFLK